MRKTWKFEDKTYLECGERMYSFEFTLPENIPPSYSSKVGDIIYEMKAEIGRSWAFDKGSKNVLTILPFLNLNWHPELKLHVSECDVKILCCWFF